MASSESEETPLLTTRSDSNPSLRKKFFAGFCTLAASATFCINNLIIQDKHLRCIDLLLFRSTLQLTVFVVWIKVNDLQWWPSSDRYSNRREYICDIIGALIQVISNEMVLTMTWLSVSLMPIGDTMALIYTSPISVMILSYLVLGHRIGLYKVLIVGVTILGAVLVVKPGIFDSLTTSPVDLKNENGVGVMVALTASFFVGAQTVTTFKLKKFSVPSLMLNSGILGLVVSLIACSIDPKSLFYQKANYGFLLLSGTLGILGLVLCIYSSQILIPMLYTVLKCQELVFSFIAQTVVLSHSKYYKVLCLFLTCPPLTSPLCVLGAVLVLLGSFLQAFEGYLRSKITNELLLRIL